MRICVCCCCAEFCHHCWWVHCGFWCHVGISNLIWHDIPSILLFYNIPPYHLGLELSNFQVNKLWVRIEVVNVKKSFGNVILILDLNNWYPFCVHLLQMVVFLFELFMIGSRKTRELFTEWIRKTLQWSLKTFLMLFCF